MYTYHSLVQHYIVYSFHHENRKKQTKKHHMDKGVAQEITTTIYNLRYYFVPQMNVCNNIFSNRNGNFLVSLTFSNTWQSCWISQVKDASTLISFVCSATSVLLLDKYFTVYFEALLCFKQMGIFPLVP